MDVAVMMCVAALDISTGGATQPSRASQPMCSNWMVVWLI